MAGIPTATAAYFHLHIREMCTIHAQQLVFPNSGVQPQATMTRTRNGVFVRRNFLIAKSFMLP